MSIDRYLEYLGFPSGTPCPEWPPDAFAVAAALLRRSGAYVRIIDPACAGGAAAACIGSKGLLDRAGSISRTGDAWRSAYPAPAPQGVIDLWRIGVDGARLKAAWSDIRTDMDVAHALILLAAIADQACIGVGLAKRGTVRTDPFLNRAEFLLARWDSLTDRVPPTVLTVMPKQHTAQRGLTVRSLSHHVALLPETEVRVKWVPTLSPNPSPSGFDRQKAFNILLAPWPLTLDATEFDGRIITGAPDQHRLFTYARRAPPTVSFIDWFTTQVRRAVSVSNANVDLVVFPEYALHPNEWNDALTVLSAHSPMSMIIGGIHDTSLAPPLNFLRVSTGGLLPAGAMLFEQRKHHRWCLDRPQLRGYGLSARLPPAFDHWEDTELAERELNFLSVENWLTMCWLICEDLARQDPVMETIRAIGPNLLVALLMDGPQLPSRWPGIFGKGLSGDPGTSVLTLTSLGACSQSRRPPSTRPAGSRVIAGWSDVELGTVELELDPGSESGLLTLRCVTKEEYTADGRGDGGVAYFPVFEAFRSL